MGFNIPDTPEELLRQGRRNLQQFNTVIPLLVLGMILLAFVFSSFYSVGPDEVGVIRRFGKYTRTESPGLHWKFPFNIDQLNIVKVQRVMKEEFGFRTLRAGVQTEYSQGSFEDESLMLTGDINVLDVTWVVQFKINDPVKLLFNIRDARAIIRDITESVMRQTIGDNSVTESLTTRRMEIDLEVQRKLQAILDSYDSGIQIQSVILQDVNPPEAVKASFNEVNEAKQEMEKVMNQAWEAYNKVVPRARGEAEKTMGEAEGYAVKRTNRAKGDAAKFIATWEAYKAARDVTDKRLYFETMQEVLPKAGKKYIFDGTGSPVLPLLNLNEGGKLHE
ncbi:MAG: FtsH protease activity modulator HflK [Candidatus Omnitrophica bacterium]|nr:FtsH protease activity modulator HflK [Candidatus Omnitrophota bacterium]